MSVWLGFAIYAIGLLGYNGTLRRLGVSPYLAWITAMLVQILILYGFAMTGWLTLGNSSRHLSRRWTRRPLASHEFLSESSAAF